MKIKRSSLKRERGFWPALFEHVQAVGRLFAGIAMDFDDVVFFGLRRLRCTPLALTRGKTGFVGIQVSPIDACDVHAK